ncbi:hypothetical protein [Tenacibaculum caenipelagi]|uniref:Uncharacterized protein n=1 Tax=Tenacibaculum caenipelagi TaxID=1325435 RepID=A0A4R6TKZ7_9FLAO|nr:hypothetical protein [Tenacibaculum caenipelagi]TDQ28831.1 hypothetical protein DFQ07_1212 [Tenacibaculum caenipelagi]
MKYWFYNGNDFIVVTDESIYVGKTKKYIKAELISGFEKGNIPKDVFSIPFSYIKSVENPEGASKIVVFYGDDSEEGIIINSKEIKNQFFLYLKENLSSFNYFKDKPKVIKFIKPQIFAILFSTGIFLWVFYLAREIEKGYQYEVVGGRQGLSGLVLGLAQFGTIKVLLGYFIVLSIAIMALTRRLKKRTLTEFLIR